MANRCEKLLCLFFGLHCCAFGFWANSSHEVFGGGIKVSASTAQENDFSTCSLKKARYGSLMLRRMTMLRDHYRAEFGDILKLLAARKQPERIAALLASIDAKRFLFNGVRLYFPEQLAGRTILRLFPNPGALAMDSQRFTDLEVTPRAKIVDYFRFPSFFIYGSPVNLESRSEFHISDYAEKTLAHPHAAFHARQPR